MKQTHYFTTKVKQGNRLDITLPDLPEGQTIEVIVIVPEIPCQAINRQAFRQLPVEERRRILAKQAEAMENYYQNDRDWKDWVNFDNEEWHESQS